MSDSDLIRAIELAEDDAFYLGDGFVRITHTRKGGYLYEHLDPQSIILATEDAKNAHSHATRMTKDDLCA